MSKAALFYEKLAEEVVSDYFSVSADPSESLAKVAHRETLNPEEIHRVAELANQEIFANLRKEPPPHDHEFELADVKKVGALLHPVKFASAPFLRKDVISRSTPPAPERPENGWDPTQVQKLAALSALYEEIYGVEQEDEDAWEEEATNTIRRFAKVAHYTAHEEGLSLEEIRDALRFARPKLASLTDSLMEYTAFHMQKPIRKEASAACSDLFDAVIHQGDGKPGKVINGDHALVMLLDTMSELERKRTVTDSKRVYVEGVKNLLGRRTTSL